MTESSHHSTPRSQNTPGVSNWETESHVGGINDYDAHIVHEGRWMLKGLKLVSAKAMLEEHFTTTQLLATSAQAQKLKVNAQRLLSVWRSISKKKDERDIYHPLKDAINDCLPDSNPDGNPYECQVTAFHPAKVGYDVGLEAKLAPDLIITPISPKEDMSGTIFSRPTVGMEIKRFGFLDPAFVVMKAIQYSEQVGIDVATTSMTGDSTTLSTVIASIADNSKLTDGQKKLIIQIMRYAILGQFSTLPYRFIFFVTITGPIARIWKFSPSGCQVTEPIKYNTNHGATLLGRFLYAVGSSPVSSIGAEIGKGMLFQELLYDQITRDIIQERMDKVANLYINQSGNKQWERGLVHEPGYWSFDFGPGKIQCRQRYDAEGNKCQNLIVFRRPIYCATHIFSRATRCYLGIDYNFLLGKKFEELMEDEASKLKIFEHVHTVKTAWQFIRRTAEINFHKLFMERRSGHSSLDEPTRVATILGGGIVSGSLQPLVSARSSDLVPIQPTTALSSPSPSRPPLRPEMGSGHLNSSPNSDTTTVQEQFPSATNDTASENGSQTSSQVPPETHYNSEGDNTDMEENNGDILRVSPTESVFDEGDELVSLPIENESEDIPESTLPTAFDQNQYFDKRKELNVKDAHLKMLLSFADHDKEAEDNRMREARELHWLVYKEVGGNLGGIRNIKEFAQILIDIVQAHKCLFDCEILHRDISGNNVMIDLSSASSDSETRRGLLIDLDMAKDIKGIKQDIIDMIDELADNFVATRPEITGTLRWMSISLRKAPEPRSWHDLESVLWIAIYYIFRHINGVSYCGRPLIDDRDRAKNIEDIFKHDTAANPLEATSKAKKAFLAESFSIQRCESLGDAISEIKNSFRYLYSTMESLDIAEDNIRDLESKGGLEAKPKSRHYESNTHNDLKWCVSKLRERVQSLAQPPTTNEVGHPNTGVAEGTNDLRRNKLSRQIMSDLDSATFLIDRLQFPTHDFVRSRFEQVLSSADADEPFHEYNHPNRLTPAQALTDIKGSRTLVERLTQTPEDQPSLKRDSSHIDQTGDNGDVRVKTMKRARVE